RRVDRKEDLGHPLTPIPTQSLGTKILPEPRPLDGALPFLCTDPSKICPNLMQAFRRPVRARLDMRSGTTEEISTCASITRESSSTARRLLSSLSIPSRLPGNRNPEGEAGSCSVRGAPRDTHEEFVCGRRRTPDALAEKRLVGVRFSSP